MIYKAYNKGGNCLWQEQVKKQNGRSTRNKEKQENWRCIQ